MNPSEAAVDSAVVSAELKLPAKPEYDPSYHSLQESLLASSGARTTAIAMTVPQ